MLITSEPKIKAIGNHGADGDSRRSYSEIAAEEILSAGSAWRPIALAVSPNRPSIHGESNPDSFQRLIARASAKLDVTTASVHQHVWSSCYHSSVTAVSESDVHINTFLHRGSSRRAARGKHMQLASIAKLSGAGLLIAPEKTAKHQRRMRLICL